MIPLYGFLEGDVIGLLVLVEEEEPVEVIGRRLEESAAVRVAPKRRRIVLHEGRLLDPRWTVAQAGLQPLDRVDVREAEEP